MKGISFSKPGQISAGLWLSAAVGLAIVYRSFSLFSSTIAVGLFFTIPTLAIRGIKVAHRGVRYFSVFVLLAWTLFSVAMMLEAVERIYFGKTDSYPMWLTTRPLAEGETLDSLEKNECKKMGVEIIQNADGVYVIRCGYSWHNAKIFTTTKRPYGGEQ